MNSWKSYLPAVLLGVAFAALASVFCGDRRKPIGFTDLECIAIGEKVAKDVINQHGAVPSAEAK